MIDSPGIHSHARGASLIQVELGLGRNAAILLWLSSLVSGIAVVGLVVAILAYQSMSAHVNVLQYDLAQLKSQLIERGLYEPTAH